MKFFFFFEKLTLVEGSGEANAGGIFGFGSLQRGVVETSQDRQRTRPRGPEAPWSRSHLTELLRSQLCRFVFDLSSPIVFELTSPIVFDLTSPIVFELTSPIVFDLSLVLERERDLEKRK